MGASSKKQRPPFKPWDNRKDVLYSDDPEERKDEIRKM